MAFNGTEGRMIPRSEAQVLINNYKNSPAFPANNDTEGIAYGKDHLAQILAQPDCVGVRIYFGKEGILPTDPAQLVIVGVDANENDMSTGLILDMGIPCPHICSSPATKI